MAIRFLTSGSRVGIVAPAGPVEAHQIEAALALLSSHNLEPVLAPHLFDRAGFVASSVENRLQDLHAFYADASIDAIWTARGGYGTIQLLEGMNYLQVQQAAKPLIGFSDITALQWGIYARSGIPAFSGFALTLQFTEENPYFHPGLEVLQGKRTEYDDVPDVRIIQSGEAEGVLLSGTLALISALVGTPFFPPDARIILCIEDVDEPLYRIDRMLFQLRLSGVLARVRGVLLGRFLWKDRFLKIDQLIQSHFSPDIPIVCDLPYGHVAASLVMPVGVPARLSTHPFKLEWDYPKIV